jgi:hypothetical protein
MSDSGTSWAFQFKESRRLSETTVVDTALSITWFRPNPTYQELAHGLIFYLLWRRLGLSSTTPIIGFQHGQKALRIHEERP